MATPQPAAAHAPANSALVSVLSLISSAVGAGVLSFPYAFRSLGWLAGLLAVAAIASLEGFTLYAVSRFAEYTKQRSYAALVHTMLGRGFSLLMCTVMLLYPFGSCVAYLVICGDSFQPLLHRLFGSEAWFTSRAAIICGVGCACILPLCFRTRLGALKAVSSLCVWGLLVVVAIVVLRSAEIMSDPEHSWAPVRAVNTESLLQSLSALVIIIFGFHSHTNVVSIFDELEPAPVFFPSSTPSADSLSDSEAPAAASSTAEAAAAGAAAGAANGAADGAAGAGGTAWGAGGGSGGGASWRRPKSAKSQKLLGMVRVVIVALAVTAVLYTCVGLAGYLAFPGTALSDITLNYDENDPLITVARAAIGLIMVAAYPINHHPARIGLHDLVLMTAGRSLAGPLFVAAETLAFFGLTLAIALRCSDLGHILKLVGGTCGAVLIFLMPGALLVAYARQKQRESRQRAAQRAALAAQATALEGGGAQLAEPLLAAGEAAAAAGPPFSVWTSKHFWTGVLLLLIAAGLFILTVFTSLHPASIN